MPPSTRRSLRSRRTSPSNSIDETEVRNIQLTVVLEGATILGHVFVNTLMHGVPCLSKGNAMLHPLTKSIDAKNDSSFVLVMSSRCISANSCKKTGQFQLDWFSVCSHQKMMQPQSNHSLFISLTDPSSVPLSLNISISQQPMKDLSQSAHDSNPRNASSSDGENGKKKTRSVTFSLEKQSPPSPSASASDTSTARRLSARAARSARRQAKIETDPTKKGSNANPAKKAFKRRNEMKNMKRNGSSNATTTKKGAGGKDEEVVKVKLNTGTLYLYKGLHRRAVFVRRVWCQQTSTTDHSPVFTIYNFSTFDRK